MIEQIMGLSFQFIAGGLIGVVFGTILIYMLGRAIVSIRDKMVNNELNDVREEHNKKIQQIQKRYNAERSKFLELLGKYRRKVRSMKIIDREKVKEMYAGGDDEDAPAAN
jgi:uncharacterized membrane-anchored protein YhcB (DUF1043 family)